MADRDVKQCCARLCQVVGCARHNVTAPTTLQALWHHKVYTEQSAMHKPLVEHSRLTSTGRTGQSGNVRTGVSCLQTPQEGQLVHIVLHAAGGSSEDGGGAVHLLNKAVVQLSGSLGQELPQLQQQGCRGGQQGSLQLLCVHSEQAHIPLHVKVAFQAKQASCEFKYRSVGT